jgi:asparagine synthase (glutamine-hydrolysing)
VCGIVGWIAFDRDLTHERDTVSAMTRSLHRRGPDAEGEWLSPHAVLGHRRLAVLDLEGGAQPMVGTGPAGRPVVLVYSGELYNYRDLRAELRGRGHRFTTTSDTEVVLRAYLEWGIGCVDRLAGMYAFGVWDAHREELLLVRDRLGVKPLYYHPRPDGVLFASEPKAILANPVFRPRTRPEDLPILFNPRLAMPGETPLADLHQVPPGHLARVNRTGTHVLPYWHLVSHEHPDDLDTTVGTVRELLEQVVAEQLVADVPRCLLLSGGLDSSAVAALAAARLPERISTYSVDFAGSAGDFRSTPLRPERDSPFALAAAAHLGTEHTDVVLDPELLPRAVPDALAARDLPTLGQFDTSMYLLFRQVRERFTVALSGEGADEVFGGYPWFLDPKTVGADTFPWLGNGPRLTECLAPDVLARVRPAEDEADRYATMLARVPRLHGETGLAARMREVLYLSLQGPLTYLLDRKDRMSMAVGLEVRVPFCDHRLLSYVWNVPWKMKTFDGREKSLLRAAVADLLPEPVLWRRKSAYPSTFAPAYGEAVRRELDALLDDPASPLTPLLDREKVYALRDRRGPLMAVADTLHLLLPLLEVDRWLRAYGVELG